MFEERNEDVIRVAETLRLLQKHLLCTICLEILQNPVSTRCGHSFCNMCVDHLFTGKKTALCPLCNKSVTRRAIVVNEKIKLLVKCARGVINAAQKDIAAIGFEDILEVERRENNSTREALSPTGQDVVDAVNSSGLKSVSKKSSRVETWLSEMPPPSLTQEPSQTLNVDISPNEDSDSELVSVSQAKPAQVNKKVSTTVKSKPLSAQIEDDGDADSDECFIKNDTTKSKQSKIKSHIAKQGEPVKSKSNQEPQTTTYRQTKLSKKNCSNPKKTEYNGGAVPDPVIVLLDGEKENSTNSPQARSPGWSRINKMKKEFHQQSKVLRSANSKGNQSPVPSIEDAGSADEEPCLNLSLDSPVLKKKARINEIVHNLESEILIFEKSGQALSTDIERRKEESIQENQNAKISLSKSISRDEEYCREGTTVTFLKLGSIISRKSWSVPIYLKGSLEHLNCANNVARIPYRVLVDAQTQTSPQHGFESSPFGIATTMNSVVNTSIAVSPSQNIQSPKSIRSRGHSPVCDLDIMDAETVLFSQPPKSKSVSNQKSESLDDIPNQQSELGNGGIYDTDTEDKVQSQSESVIFSQDIERSPNQLTGSVSNALAISHVDLDQSSSSSINEGNNCKRMRTLPCSSDSSDTDLEISVKHTKKRKKTKTQVLSDSEDSCQPDLNILPEISLLDTSLPDPESRAKIKANIEAALKDTQRSQSPEWYNPDTEKISAHQSVHIPEDLVVLSDESQTQMDSDCDSVINPTPQKQSSFMSRNVTQSDDIVPSSQPPVADHKSPATLLQNPQRDGLTRAADAVTNEGRQEAFSQESTCEVQDSCPPPPVVSVKPDREASREVTPVILNASSNTKPSFVCSSLTANLVSQVEKLAKTSGGEFSSKFTANTTHLVVRVDEENKADKTLKYLCAIAAGKWVVSFLWVQKCLEAGKLLPEEPFEALDASGEPGPRRSRECHLLEKKLFQNFEFCCIGDFPDLSKGQLEALLIDSGAVVVKSPTDFSFRDNVIPLTLASYDEDREQEFNSWLEHYSAPLIQHEWVLECIGKYYVTSFAPLLLCDASDDILQSMHIPAYLYESNDSE